MDEVFNLYGVQLERLAKQSIVDEQFLQEVSNYAFENDFNIFRLGIFLAYCHKILQNHPNKKQEIYEIFFKVITNKINFDSMK